jgi:hypothetical protein
MKQTYHGTHISNPFCLLLLLLFFFFADLCVNIQYVRLCCGVKYSNESVPNESRKFFHSPEKNVHTTRKDGSPMSTDVYLFLPCGWRDCYDTHTHTIGSVRHISCVWCALCTLPQESTLIIIFFSFFQILGSVKFFSL